MFAVCRVDPYDDFGLVHQIIGCFEKASDAESTAEYLNLKHVHDLIEHSKKQDESYCMHLVSIVEKNEGINEPYDTYIVVEVPEAVVYTPTQIKELRKHILDH